MSVFADKVEGIDYHGNMLSGEGNPRKEPLA